MVYKCFFSWQTDKEGVSKRIEVALKNAFKKLRGEGINIELDKAPLSTTGSKTLEEVIIEKIEECDFFVGDLSPVTTFTSVDGKVVKLMPNSNAIFEYGYAMSHLGPDKVLAFVEMEVDYKIPDLPFDLNHRTINIFKPGEEVIVDIREIRQIIEIINNEIANRKPKHNCVVVFEDEKNEITLHPKYNYIRYFAPNKNRNERNISQNMYAFQDTISMINNPIKAFLESQSKIANNFNLPKVEVRVNKGTINHSIVPVRLYLQNLGEVIDDCEIKVWPDENGIIFKESNEKRNSILPSIRNNYDIIIKDQYSWQKFETIIPHKRVFIGEIFLSFSEELRDYFKEKPGFSFDICWVVIGRQISHPIEGKLKVVVEPEINYDCKESNKRDGEIEIEESIEYL